MPVARIAGQFAGIAISAGVMRIPSFKVADLTHHAVTLNEATFSINLISAIIENIAIIYIVLPLIPALHIKTHKHKQHNQLKETDRQNQRIALAAIALGALRFCMWKIFNTENPCVAFVLYLQKAWQKNDIGSIWQEYPYVLGGQAVATILCIVYALYFIKPHRLVHQ